MKRAAWIAAILVAAALGIYFRLYPVTVFPRDLSLNTAKFMVLAQMRQAAGRIVDQQDGASALRPAERARRVDALVTRKVHEDRKGYQEVLERNARALELQSRTVSRGGYLLEVDPYHYLSQTRNILRTGRISERTRGREFLNPMTLAPAGYWYPMDFHPWVGAWVYRIVSAARPGVDLVAVVRWIPLALALAALLVLAYFCGSVIGITGWAGLMALVYGMLCPMFLKRSLVGWYDTDPYNVLLPLAAIVGIFVAFGPAGTVRRRWLGAAGAGAAFGLHALFWRGWSIPFLAILTFVALSALIPARFRTEGPGRRFHLALTTLIAAVPAAVILIFWGLTGLRQEAASAYEFIRGFARPDFRPWPDVFITVGELKPMEFRRVTELLGGPLWVGAALTGVAARLVRQLRTRDAAAGGTVPLFVLLSVACLGLLVSVRIQRFAILAAAPLAACMPFAWSEWRRAVSNALPHLLAPRAVTAVRARLGAVWAAAMVTAIGFLGTQAHAEIVRFYPLYNPAWDRMMTRVREKTPEDAIITSWWSPGHFLTSMGERRVTFDGSSQNEPQAYWVANLFIENSERSALGILRMLNTSGNASVDHLTAQGWSIADSVSLIRSIVPLSRTDARGRLLRRFSAEEADRLLDLTHGAGNPPPSYLFTYNHMIEQALALEFIGRWNFKKAEAFGEYVKQRSSRIDRRALSRATPQNRDLLWSMSEKPTFYETEGYEVGRDGDRIFFSNGVILNTVTRQAEIRGGRKINGRTASVFWMSRQNELIETPGVDPTLNVSVLWIEDLGKDGRISHRSVIMGRRIAGSVGMRLYYWGGRGLKFVRPVDFEDSAADRTRLGLFEVDWDRFDADGDRGLSA